MPTVALQSIRFTEKLRRCATGFVLSDPSLGIHSLRDDNPVDYARSRIIEGWMCSWLGTTVLIVAVIDFLMVKDKTEDSESQQVNPE